MNVPRFLKEGDEVAIVATAKRLESDFSKAVGVLESWGLKVRTGLNVKNQQGYFAGTDEERIKDVQEALNDPSVKAIIFARGGYGTTRILDQIDFAEYLRQPKWLVGFSDLTSILLHSTRLSVPCIHGPVAVTIGKDQISDENLKATLFGKSCFEYPLLKSLNSTTGQCSGKIVGGNLSMLYESIGANNDVDTTGNILFLEEIGEAKYSVDRMMNKLRRTGKLNGLSGAVIGSFSNISDGKSYFEERVEEILMQYLGPLNVPVAIGLEAGHELRNYPLVLGVSCQMEIYSDRISIEYLK